MIGRVPLRLVIKNLFKHPLRSLLTMASLAAALFLLCVLRSVVVTLDAGVKSARSDRIIVQSAGTARSTTSSYSIQHHFVWWVSSNLTDRFPRRSGGMWSACRMPSSARFFNRVIAKLRRCRSGRLCRTAGR